MQLLHPVGPHDRDGRAGHGLRASAERDAVDDGRHAGGDALGVVAGAGSGTLLLLLVLFYVILGMFMDAMSMLVLTVPIAVPMVTVLGVDPIWFGIFIVVMCEIALITPPMGMNLFVVQGVRKGGAAFPT
jgi:TRAP-type mannitol/chloroaromatic compound transport system permease large subunit